MEDGKLSDKLHVTSEYNRSLYEDKGAMKTTVAEVFKTEGDKKSAFVKDETTGARIYPNRKTAERKYGSEKAYGHYYEADHSYPLKQIHEDFGKSAWLSDSDIKEIANNKMNLNPVIARSNREYKDKSYGEIIQMYEKKGKTLSENERAELFHHKVIEKEGVVLQFQARKAQNIGKTAMNGAIESLKGSAPIIAHSTAKNAIDLVNGNISGEEAIEDIGTTTAKLAARGAANDVIGHQLEHFSNQIANKVANKVEKKLIDKNTLTKIGGIVFVLKDSTKSYVNGNIDGKEYLKEVFEDGLGYLISLVGYGVNPVVGYVIDSIYDELVAASRQLRLSKRILQEVTQMERAFSEQQKTYRKNFMAEFNAFYQGREEIMDKTFQDIEDSIWSNDIDRFLGCLNRIGQACGIQYALGSYEEIDNRMKDKGYIWQF